MKAKALAASTLLALFFMAPGAESTSAQTPLERLLQGAKKLEQGCAEDLAKFCSTVSPGEGRQFFCILAHEDKISTKCDYALFDAARNLQRGLERVAIVADACWADIEKNCANAVPGGGNIVQCLVAKTDALSPGCRSTLTTLQAAK